MVLVWPHVGGTELNIADGLYQVVAILVMFPLIVAIGAGSRVTDDRSMKVCKFLGDISYPLYVTHYPWIYLHMTWAATHKDAPMHVHILVAVSIMIIAIAIAYAVLRLYDEPVRKWLRDKLFSKPVKA